MIERDEFVQAVDANYERIYRLARTMSGRDEDARDLAQETFLEALKGLDSFRHQASMSTWLIGILRRRFLLSLRQRRAPDSAPAAEPIQTARYETPEQPDMCAALAQLSEPVHTTLVLFYYDKMDYASIAEALGCPIGTVRSRLHQGREQLRKILAPVEEKTV